MEFRVVKCMRDVGCSEFFVKSGVWAFVNDAHTVGGYGEEAKLDDGVYDVETMYLLMRRFGIKEFVGVGVESFYGNNEVRVKKKAVMSDGSFSKWNFDELMRLLCGLQEKVCNEGEKFEVDKGFVRVSKRFRDSGDIIVYCGGIEDEHVKYGVSVGEKVKVDGKLFANVIRVYEVGGCSVWIKKDSPVIFSDGIVVMEIAPKVEV